MKRFAFFFIAALGFAAMQAQSVVIFPLPDNFEQTFLLNNTPLRNEEITFDADAPIRAIGNGAKQ